ncbi:hypothetical protein Pcinc_040326 [Petrolisthes cinctipes]|uniref:Uncharacterized protein n=1 Tax=Petrolisthes cinctipes TaxID=88211 RepID=A0AAE1BLR3_PETCI|nr:hypothetical protein Pcinc_040326 [Petrolisthes cinctipes]
MRLLEEGAYIECEERGLCREDMGERGLVSWGAGVWVEGHSVVVEMRGEGLVSWSGRALYRRVGRVTASWVWEMGGRVQCDQCWLLISNTTRTSVFADWLTLLAGRVSPSLPPCHPGLVMTTQHHVTSLLHFDI